MFSARSASCMILTVAERARDVHGRDEAVLDVLDDCLAMA